MTDLEQRAMHAAHAGLEQLRSTLLKLDQQPDLRERALAQLEEAAGWLKAIWSSQGK